MKSWWRLKFDIRLNYSFQKQVWCEVGVDVLLQHTTVSKHKPNSCTSIWKDSHDFTHFAKSTNTTEGETEPQHDTTTTMLRLKASPSCTFYHYGQTTESLSHMIMKNLSVNNVGSPWVKLQPSDQLKDGSFGSVSFFLEMLNLVRLKSSDRCSKLWVVRRLTADDLPMEVCVYILSVCQKVNK